MELTPTTPSGVMRSKTRLIGFDREIVVWYEYISEINFRNHDVSKMKMVVRHGYRLIVVLE
jgi:hypothetical protein